MLSSIRFEHNNQTCICEHRILKFKFQTGQRSKEITSHVKPKQLPEIKKKQLWKKKMSLSNSKLFASAKKCPHKLKIIELTSPIKKIPDVNLGYAYKMGNNSIFIFKIG